MLRPITESQSERFVATAAPPRRASAEGPQPPSGRGSEDAPHPGESGDGDPQVENLPEEAPDYVRCPGCGMRVVLPCVYCRAVSYGLRRRRGVVGGIGQRAA